MSSSTALPPQPPAPVMSPARRLVGVAAVGGTGLVIALAYHQLGVGIPCPMLALTGWWCPLCGSSRMSSAVLEGQFATAFAWNPAMFIGLLLLGAISVSWLVELLTRRPPPWRSLTLRLNSNQWLLAWIVIGAVWMVARNIGRIAIGG